MFKYAHIKKLYLSMALLMFVSLIKAGQIPLISAPTTITSNDTVQYNFCSLNDPQYIRVYIKSRFPYATFAGSSFGIYIEINGQPVKAAVSRTIGRFLNDNLTSPVTTITSGSWFHPVLGWRTIYAPDYSTPPDFYTHDPYVLELDVSDLISTTTGNVISITNKNSLYSLEVSDLKIITYNYSTTSPTLAAAASMTPYVNRGEPAAGPAAYTYSVLAGGGFTVTVKEKTWEFGTDLSYPNTYGKYDKLVPSSTPDTTSGEANWTVEKEGNTINAWGTTFAITRNFEFSPNKITVTDVILNQLETPQALILDHHVDLSGMTNPAVSLSGNFDPVFGSHSSAGNPSVFIAASDHGLGMVYDDDISRAHAKMYFSPSEPPLSGPPATCSAGLRDQMLCIPANSTYTNVWSIYPVDSTDYYDFVNMVRQEWGANFTIEGGYCWFDANIILNYTVNEVRDYLNFNGIKYAIVTGQLMDIEAETLRVGFGMAILDNYWTSYRAVIRSAAALLRQADSDIKVGIYYNSNRDSSEISYSIANKRTLSDGSISYLDFGYGEEIITTNMVPTTTNDFGSDLLDLIDDCIMEAVGQGDPALGLDGIYCDEMETIQYNSPLVTYNMQDGNSCEIDMSSFTISQQYGVTALLMKQHNLDTIDAIKNNGGVSLGNTPPFSKDMLATHMPRFSEAFHPNALYEYEAHLGTPLGFMFGGGTFDYIVTALERGIIPIWPVLHSTTYPIIKYFWPLTVMEMHSGYFLAQERIITIHAGTYGWRAGNSMVQIRRFNTSGILQGTTSYSTTVPGSTTNISTLTEGEAIVIERLPITIDTRP